ncbi:MAG TPA: protein-tyrosine-phosphatase [Acidimicrobiaceae bacterium]|nr:protein-tyrosine-phosphatase [Acidimicrobiaceae bacterium]
MMSFDSLPTVGDDPRRVVRLDAVHNFRDLGGYPTVDGRVTRWGRLYRADGLYRLTADDLEVVRGLGLQLVVDLRTDQEIDLHDRFPVAYHPVRYRQLSVLDQMWTDLPEIDITGRSPEEFLEWAYLDMLRTAGERFAMALDHLAQPGHLPAVFHCAAGKDRTGVLALLVLGALGVRHEYIVADYALSADGMERMREWARRESPERLDRMAENPLVFSEALPASMHGVIDAIVQRHGSLRDYVLHLGVPAESLARLEAELLEPL